MSADLLRAKELLDAEQYGDAHKIAAAALKQNPHNVVALDIVVETLMRTEQSGLAYHMIQASRVYHDGPDAWHNLAYCLNGENPETHAEAQNWLEKALEGGGDIPNTLSMLACLYTNMREPDLAIRHAEDALKIDPERVSAKWNAALALLMKRQWRRGWEWYDEIIGRTPLRPPRLSFGDTETPVWDGDGGTVVVSSEQGLGDEIMFASIIPDAVKAAETLIVQCDPRLVNLYRRSFPRAIISPRGKPGELFLPEPREITHSIPVGSLGRLFRNRDEEFTGKPYLKADPERCVQWRALLDTLPGKKIGIMWQGGLADTGEQKRSMQLLQLGPLLSNAGHTFVSLNHRSGQRSIDAAGFPIRYWHRALRTDDYDDTAGLVNELDAVVTVTSTVAHLAGALGKRAHVLVPGKPRWTYGLTGNRMIWYDSVRLYRQMTDGEWGAPVTRIAERLASW